MCADHLSPVVIKTIGISITESPRQVLYILTRNEIFNQENSVKLRHRPTSSSAHEILWTEIPCYTVFQFADTVGVPPQIAVNKEWRYMGALFYT